MKRFWLSLMIGVVSGTVGFAQMMGGGSGNNPSGSAPYMQMFQSMSSAGGMGSGMGIGMTEDLAVDTDGTAYVIRAVAGTQSTDATSPAVNWQYELAAISPVDGSLKWKLTIPGGRVSNPRLGGDGRIFLTVDNYQKFYANYVSGGMMMSGNQALSNDGQLIIVAHTDSSASIQASIQTSSDALSAPQIVAGTTAGSYLVYVVGYDMMSWTQGSGNSTGSFAPGNKVLYAFQPDGTLKFSVRLAQTSTTLMP